MITFESKEAMLKHFDFEPETRLDEKRAMIAWGYYVNQYHGDGWYGCVRELLNATKNSKKLSVSTQNKCDNYVNFINANGKRISVKAESKVNGGRIDDISYNDKSYVIYSLEVHNSLADRSVSPRVIRADIFLDKLRELNAIKEVRHGGVVDGHGIQPTNKKLYIWLLDECVEYHRDWTYYPEDFE